MKSPIGTIPAGWRTAQLADLTTRIGSGATPLGGSKVYLDQREQFALIRSQNVCDRQFETDGLAFISTEAANQLSLSMVHQDDVLLNITGDGVTFSRSCMVPVEVLPACVNQHVAIIRTKTEMLDPGYLLSFLTHPSVKAYIASFNTGASRRAITKAAIESFVLPLPPVDVQRRIASVLSAYDDLIENNQKRIAVLEEMARALYREWFGQQQRTSLRTVPGDQPALDWRAGILSRLFAVVRNQIDPRMHPEEEFDYFSYQAFDEGRSPSLTPGRDIQSVKFEVQPDCLLVPKLNPHIPRVWLPASLSDRRAICSTEYLVLVPNEHSSREFLYFLFEDPEFLRTLVVRADGTSNSHKRLKPDDLLARPVLIPPRALIDRFTDEVRPMLEQCDVFRRSTRTLRATRDLLLPRLISGELDVSRVPDPGSPIPA